MNNINFSELSRKMASSAFDSKEHAEFSRYILAHEKILDEAIRQGYKMPSKSVSGIVMLLNLNYIFVLTGDQCTGVGGDLSGRFPNGDGSLSGGGSQLRKLRSGAQMEGKPKK